MTTSTDAALGRRPPPARRPSRACRTALSTRFCTTRRSSSGSASTVGSAPGRTVTGTRAGVRAATSSQQRPHRDGHGAGGAAGVGVGAGQQQQVLDQPAEPVRRRRAAPPAARPPSPSRSATSSWVRILASGLRSSWAASATKARCRARAGGQPVEHLVEGHGQRVDLVVGHRHRQPLGPAASPLIRSAPRPQLLDRAQRRSRSTRQAIGGQHDQHQREQRSAGRCAAPPGLASTSPTGSADDDAHRAVGRPGGHRPDAERHGQRRPGAGHLDAPPRPARGPARRAAAAASAGRRSTEPADHPLLGVDHLHHLGAGHRHRARQPARVDQRGDLVGGRPAPRRPGCGRRRRSGRRRRRTPPASRATADAGDADDHQPGPQAQPGRPAARGQRPLTPPAGSRRRGR